MIWWNFDNNNNEITVGEADDQKLAFDVDFKGKVDSSDTLFCDSTNISASAHYTDEIDTILNVHDPFLPLLSYAEISA